MHAEGSGPISLGYAACWVWALACRQPWRLQGTSGSVQVMAKLAAPSLAWQDAFRRLTACLPCSCAAALCATKLSGVGLCMLPHGSEHTKSCSTCSCSAGVSEAESEDACCCAHSSTCLASSSLNAYRGFWRRGRRVGLRARVCYRLVSVRG